MCCYSAEPAKMIVVKVNINGYGAYVNFSPLCSRCGHNTHPETNKYVSTRLVVVCNQCGNIRELH